MRNIKVNKDSEILRFSLILFVANPFFGTLLSLIMGLLFFNKNNKLLTRYIFFYVVGFACLVQMTANVDKSMTDWSAYVQEFQSIKYLSLSTFVSEIYKEPLWSLLNYVLYYILCGNAAAFIKLIAMSTFIMAGYSMYKYWKYTETPTFILVAMFALLFFFSEYWGSLANLLRMQFALSIVSLAFTKKLTTGKTSWFIYICAALIHTFCIIFLAISFIKPLYHKMRLRDVGIFILIIVGVLILMSHLSFFLTIFSNAAVLNYGFDRLSTATDPNDLNTLNEMTIYINATIVGGICLYMNYITKPLSQNLFYTNLLLVLMVLCALLASITPEIMSRLYVSRFLIFPFVLPFFMVRNKPISMALSIGIFVFLFVRFCETFDSISLTSVYPKWSELIFYSIFTFIM